MMTSREMVDQCALGVTSEWKVRSNRRNSTLSTGPRTPEGKTASSRNAYRHGYRALMPAPDERGPEVEALRKRWIDDLAPRNSRALFYADMSFRAKRRLDAITDADDAARAERMRDASRLFLEKRYDEVEEAVAMLLDQPFKAQMRLLSTVMGCERMGILLDEVEAAYRNKTWNREHCRMLAALWGRGGHWPDTDLEAATALIESKPGEEAAEQTLLLIVARIVDLRILLKQQVEELADEEEHSRRLAFEIAKCDTSTKGQLYHRYYRDNQRDFFRWTEMAVRLNDESSDIVGDGQPLTLVESSVEHLGDTGTIVTPLPDPVVPEVGQPIAFRPSAFWAGAADRLTPAPNEAKANVDDSAGRTEQPAPAGSSFVPITVGAPPRTS